MKKIYFAPKTTIVKVELQQIIAASTLNIDGDTGTSNVNEETPDGPVLSHGGSIWDEE